MATQLKDASSYRGYFQREEGTSDIKLTQVGPGTPGGEYMRRFWHPVAYEGELGKLPLRIRALGEDLVAFRDGRGKVGVLQLKCCHRGTSLEYGQIEERGLRCCYHGRLYGTDGSLLDAPGEPDETAALLRGEAAQGAYPVELRYGMVFIYMGRPDRIPPFPQYDRFNIPSIELHPGIRMPFPCNWVQVQENTMDPAHTATLHALPGNRFAQEFGVFPELDFAETPVGCAYFAARRVDDNIWIRSTDVLMPTLHSITSVLENGKTPKPCGAPWMSLWTTPVDDEHCINFTVLHLADGENLQHRLSGIGFGQSGDRPYEERQQVPGDWDAMVSQGRITRHSKEHLGTMDRGVVMFRRQLKRCIEAVERGEEPPDYLPGLNDGIIPTYGNDRVVPISSVNGDPDDPRVLRAFMRQTIKDYLENPPLLDWVNGKPPA
jgi:phenylpropionate dioxygenase-like ring-hydroxylating dioxygenase large terminal subunit